MEKLDMNITYSEIFISIDTRGIKLSRCHNDV